MLNMIYKDTPGSNFTLKSWGLGWIKQHATGKPSCIGKTLRVSFRVAASRIGKPVILEEFGVSGIGTPRDNFSIYVPMLLFKANKTDIYPAWVDLALSTGHA